MFFYCNIINFNVGLFDGDIDIVVDGIIEFCC